MTVEQQGAVNDSGNGPFGLFLDDMYLEIVIFLGDDDMSAVFEFTEQQFLRQSLLDLVLDEACHGPRAHDLVIAMRAQPLARGLIHIHGDLLVIQLCLQLDQELVHHVLYGLAIQRFELDDGVQPVAEFGGEGLFDDFHGIRRMILVRESHRRPADALGAGIGGHDNNHVAKIGLAAVGVGQGYLMQFSYNIYTLYMYNNL